MKEYITINKKYQGCLGHFEIKKVNKIYLSLSLFLIQMIQKDYELNI